jgi:mercuric ion transport protein
MRIEGFATVGSLVSGVLASACCLGPLVLGLMGISGAAFAHEFEPFRPYLLVVTYALLGAAFYLSYRPETECGPGGACAMPRARDLGKAILWVATVLVILATTFPWYAQYLPI